MEDRVMSDAKTTEQTEKDDGMSKLEVAARPLIQYLNENHHPHTKVIVDPTSAEVVEGTMCIQNNEFLKD